MALTLAATLLTVLTAACAQAPGEQATAPVRSSAADPVALIGVWQVHDADGRQWGARLDAGDLRIWDDQCPGRLGSWHANTAGMFIADVFGWVGQCAGDRTPDWLAATTGFDLAADGPVLLDRDGDVTAQLRPGPPMPGPADALDPPEITDEVRQSYQPAAALPAGFPAADAGALVGRWHPVDPPISGAYLELDPDGRWRGYDGCNHHGGGWVAGQDGLLLAVGGVSTLIGCDNVPVDRWLTGTSRVGHAERELVLFDTAGGEIARLRRA